MTSTTISEEYAMDDVTPLESRLIVTGSRGKMGSELVRHLRDRRQVVSLDYCGGLSLFSAAMEAESVLHFAVDWSSGWRTVQMLAHILNNYSMSRLVLASSVTVDPSFGFTAWTDYQAAKASSEAFARAWARAQPHRRAVSLRLGHFGPTPAPSPEEEAVRLTPAGLRYWVDRALSDEPRTGELTVWNAVGSGGSAQ